MQIHTISTPQMHRQSTTKTLWVWFPCAKNQDIWQNVYNVTACPFSTAALSFSVSTGFTSAP
jgi:hypothetical protein